MPLLKKYFHDTIIFTFVSIIGLKVSYLSEKVTEINKFDESIYLYRGTTIDPFIKSHHDGFFYYGWYKFLSMFTDNNIELYFFNNSILLVLPGLLLYIFLRVIKVNILLSFLAAAIFVLSAANVFTVPFITKFALCIILTGFIIIYNIKDTEKKLLYSVFLSAILIYIRPEFVLTFGLTAIVYIFYVLKSERTTGQKNLIRNFTPLIFIILLMIFFNPISRHRANESFSQHYSKDIMEKQNNQINNLEYITSPEEIMREHFSTDNSVSQAFINNPKLFFAHMGFNALRLNNKFIDILPYFIFQNNNDKNLNSIYYFTAFLLISSSLYFIILRIRSMNFGWFSLIYFLFALPPLISVLLFYPRVHYMIFIFAFVLIYISYEVSQRISISKQGKHSFAATVIIGILISAFVPFRAETGSVNEKNVEFLNAVKTIDQLKFKDSVNFLAVGPGILTYLKTQVNYISDVSLKKPVNDFISENKVNLILADSYFFNNNVVKSDTNINRLLDDTDFVKINIPGNNDFLLVRKNIIE